jgi:hypothetical protein
MILVCNQVANLIDLHLHLCLQKVFFGSRDAGSAAGSNLVLAPAVHTANSAAAAMPLPHVLPPQSLLNRTKSGDDHISSLV